MSQSGPTTLVSATEFVTDSGSASPIGDVLNIVGADGVQTSGDGFNTITISSDGTLPDTFVANSGTATPSLGSISILGSGYINTSASGSTVTITASGAGTITGNTGGAISQSANNWNTVGTGSITIAGSGSTLTTQLTGLSSNSILYGQGTPTLGQVTSANSASLVTTSAGVPTLSSTMTNGQVIIGSTGATPTAAALTAGANITVANGAGSITIASTKANQEIYFGAEQLQALETNFAPLQKLAGGSGVNVFVRAFDTSTEEYANSKLQVPSDINTSGNATFTAYVMAQTAAASKNIGLTFGHLARSTGEDFDPASPYTEVDTGAVSINATQDYLTLVTWSTSLSTLGWAANEIVMFRLSRDTSVANNLATDMYLFSLNISLPRL